MSKISSFVGSALRRDFAALRGLYRPIFYLLERHAYASGMGERLEMASLPRVSVKSGESGGQALRWVAVVRPKGKSSGQRFQLD